MISGGGKRRRRVILIISVIALIALIVMAVRSCGNDSEIEYVYKRMTKGAVVNTIYVSGKLDLDSTSLVKSNVPGVVKKVNVELNHNVRKGSVLAEIDAPDLLFEVRQSQESYTQLKLSLDAALDVLETKQSLYNDQLVPEKELSAAKRDYERALSLFRQGKNKLDELNKDLRQRHVRAPIAGQILQVWAEEMMSVGKGTNLFQIASNMKKLNLILNIDESDVGVVTLGKPVEFNVTAYSNKVFKGKITKISSVPVSTQGVVTYTAWAECDNSSLLLKPGMSVTASVFIAKKESVLRVQNEALTITPVFSESIAGKRFVWKKTSSIGQSDFGGMTRVEVKTGLSGNGFTEFISGDLKEGDEILVKIVKNKKGKSLPGI